MRKSKFLVGIMILMATPAGLQAADGGGGGQPTAEGVFAPTPVGERTCMAIQVPLNALQALAGVRWYNNDGTLSFPAFLLASGFNETPPLYDQAVVVAEDVTGESNGWSEVSFESPVASQTEALYLIIQLPAFAERVGVGAEGGPGLGYQTAEEAVCVFLSPDGDAWVRLNTHCAVLVEPILVPREAGMLALAAPRTPATDLPPVSWKTELLGGYPNPFNPLTHVEFTLSQAMQTRVDVFDLRGRLVCRLCDEIVPAGRHVVEWRGVDRAGRAVASGVYIAHMRAGSFRQTKRLLLLR
jgi:hypothetical protein